MAKKSVVVLGAGFGGLRAAIDISKELRRLALLEKYEVVLVDRNDCHLYTPLLYKVAGSPDGQYQNKCTYDTSSLLKNLPLRFVKSEVAGIDLAVGDVPLKNGEKLHADYLVVALGSETNYFGIPGLKENALQLKSLENAIQIRGAVMRAFAKGGNVNIVTGGAGPNGIELAAEIRGWADQAQEDNKDLQVSVSIVEAMPSVLPGFDARVVTVAMNRLRKLGIKIFLNAKITAVSTNEIGVAEGASVPFDVFIWTGGIKTPDTVTAMPVQKEPHGKPLMAADMLCVPGTPDLKLAPMVYGLGDSVCFMNPKTGRPVPAVARAAISQGSIVAHNIIEEIKKSESDAYRLSLETYHPVEYPYVIPIGENWAAAKFGPFVFSGWFGAIFEKLIALNYLRSIMPFDGAMKAWKDM